MLPPKVGYAKLELVVLNSRVKLKIFPAHNPNLREIRVAGVEHVVVLVGDDGGRDA